MKLACISSGSIGNCYILKADNGKILLLDLGAKLKDITANPLFTTWYDVEGALITHSHKDHSLSALEVSRCGISVYSYFNGESNGLFKIGETWAVMPFDGVHDVPVKGFIIKCLTENKIIVYATDTAFLPPIANVDFWLVECNNDAESFNGSVQSGKIEYCYLQRVMETHMSLEYLENYFKINSDRIKKPDLLIACHLSATNANPKTIKKRLSALLGKVDIARKGKEWELCSQI